MIRFILRRLAFIPLALLLVNFLSFAYAHLVRPTHLQRNPFFASTIGDRPVAPAYLAYLGGISHLDFGSIVLPGAASEPVGPLVAAACGASLGLLAFWMRSHALRPSQTTSTS